MEDIPNKNFRDLETSLSEIKAEKSEFTQSGLTRRSGVEESQVLLYLTNLCEENALIAKIRVHCPKCDQEHGTYSTKGEVPEEMEYCFCGKKFLPAERTNWTVVYEFGDDIDFFLSRKASLSDS